MNLGVKLACKPKFMSVSTSDGYLSFCLLKTGKKMPRLNGYI